MVKLKILAICSAIDIKERMGNTPTWWQLLKSLNELGHDIIEVSYLGQSIESLWWRTYPNPCLNLSKVSRYFQNRLRAKKLKKSEKSRSQKPEKKGIGNKLTKTASQILTIPKWKRHLNKIFSIEKEIDVIFIFNIPLTQFEGIAKMIKKEIGIPVIYFEYDMPVRLPKYAKDRKIIDYFHQADLSEYTAFIVNSTGVLGDLKELGAPRVFPLHEAADPDFFFPLNMEKRYDIAYYAHGNQQREKWMKKMITEPSKKLNESKFIVGGKDFNMDLGNAKIGNVVPMSTFKHFCASSKINLNITREPFTKVYMSSTCRIFELPAMGCCVVSNPASGLENWFEPNKEIIILKENDNIVDVYNWLLNDEAEREKLGRKARERVIKEHTYKHRAKELIRIINTIK